MWKYSQMDFCNTYFLVNIVKLGHLIVCDITMSFTSIISHSVIGLRHYRASGKLIKVHLKPSKLHRVFTQRYLGKLKKDPSLDKLIGLVLKCVKNAFYCIYILFHVF